jgi:hypothetical protein
VTKDASARLPECRTDWSGFIIEQLMRFVSSKFADMDQQYSALRTADDLRYQQRFDAQQKALEAAALAAEKAVNAALAAAEKAVNAAQQAAEKSVAAALASAEKAIEKAEAAQAAHNVSQNEWRQTVNDLTKTVAETARHEAETLVSSLRQTTDIARDAAAKETAAITARVGSIEAVTHGIRVNRDDRRADNGSVMALIALCATLAGVLLGAIGLAMTRPSSPPLAPVVATAPLSSLHTAP